MSLSTAFITRALEHIINEISAREANSLAFFQSCKNHNLLNILSNEIDRLEASLMDMLPTAAVSYSVSSIVTVCAMITDRAHATDAPDINALIDLLSNGIDELATVELNDFSSNISAMRSCIALVRNSIVDRHADDTAGYAFDIAHSALQIMNLLEEREPHGH